MGYNRFFSSVCYFVFVFFFSLVLPVDGIRRLFDTCNTCSNTYIESSSSSSVPDKRTGGEGERYTEIGPYTSTSYNEYVAYRARLQDIVDADFANEGILFGYEETVTGVEVFCAVALYVCIIATLVSLALMWRHRRSESRLLHEIDSAEKGYGHVYDDCR